MLRQQPSGDLKVTRVPRGRGAFVDGLSGAPNGVYLVEIDPASYLGAGGFWVADVDIDDANGLAHVFQVLRNQLTKRPTHPYDIHELLLFYQKLDAGYTLEV